MIKETTAFIYKERMFKTKEEAELFQRDEKIMSTIANALPFLNSNPQAISLLTQLCSQRFTQIKVMVNGVEAILNNNKAVDVDELFEKEGLAVALDALLSPEIKNNGMRAASIAKVIELYNKEVDMTLEKEKSEIVKPSAE